MMIQREHRRSSTRHGLTLMELLVVLLILSILTLVAVQATDMIVEQARFDATQRTLQNVRESVIGPTNAQGADGGHIISGFVADMGRLPRATQEDRGTVSLLTMKDLWNSPDAAAFPFAVRKLLTGADADPEISLPCGWRGPYLRLPPGVDRLYDGWGQELVTPLGAASSYSHLRDGADAPLTAAGQPIALVRSLGRGNSEGGVDFEGDAQVVFGANEFLGTVQGTVKVQVFDKDGLDVTDKLENGVVVVRVFVPDPLNVALAVVKTTDKAVSLDGSASFMPGDFTAGYVAPATTAGQIFAGPRVVRASYTGKYKGADVSATPLKSTPITLMVRPGGNVVQQIRIVHKLTIN